MHDRDLVGPAPTGPRSQHRSLVVLVVSANLARRHLGESQRAMVAARLETTTHGGDRTEQDANLHLDRETAAELAHTSTRSVSSARKVVESGAPALVEAGWPWR